MSTHRYRGYDITISLAGEGYVYSVVDRYGRNKITSTFRFPTSELALNYAQAHLAMRLDNPPTLAEVEALRAHDLEYADEFDDDEEDL